MAKEKNIYKKGKSVYSNRKEKQKVSILNIRKSIFISNLPDEVHDAVFDYTNKKEIIKEKEAELKKEKKQSEKVFSRKVIKLHQKDETKHLARLKKVSKKHDLNYREVIIKYQA